MELNEIVNIFIRDTEFEISEIGNGLINNTFLVAATHGKYILQKINTGIFKSPEVLVENHLKVNEVLKQSPYSRQIIELIPDLKGDFLAKDNQEQHWRMLSFVHPSKTFDKVPNATIAFEAAKCFGEFYKVINNQKIVFTDALPDFVNFEKRVSDYKSVIENAHADRKQIAAEEIAWMYNFLSFPNLWRRLVNEGKLPIRNIHGDPKISNILFNSDAQAIAVIDLDTVMNAPILYDFGDMARSYCNLTNEDDGALINNFSPEIYQSVKQGFLYHLKNSLTETELELLDYAAQTVVLIQSMRFLGDYLLGDIYYKTDYATHNLDRSKNQIHLFKQMQIFFKSYTF